MRHARAGRAIVTLRSDADAVVVDVDDNGTSGPPSARQLDGNGLVGMHERAATCGGRSLTRPASCGPVIGTSEATHPGAPESADPPVGLGLVGRGGESASSDRR